MYLGIFPSQLLHEGSFLNFFFFCNEYCPSEGVESLGNLVTYNWEVHVSATLEDWRIAYGWCMLSCIILD